MAFEEEEEDKDTAQEATETKINTRLFSEIEPDWLMEEEEEDKQGDEAKSTTTTAAVAGTETSSEHSPMESVVNKENIPPPLISVNILILYFYSIFYFIF